MATTITVRWMSTLSLVVGSLLVNCSQRDTAPSVTVNGSSTVFPISKAVADQFEKRNPVKVDVTVPVGISGTHGGFLKFCDAQTDISNASRPINQQESERCARNGVEYIEVPIGYDGIAVVVNPKNTWAADITVAELKTMWEPRAEGKVVRWNQVRQEWPDRALHLYGPGVDSGTYDYFTDAVVGEEHSSRKDYKASEDDDILVEDVVRDEEGLAFFGYAYVQKNADRLKVLAVDDGVASNGAEAVSLSPETVRTGAYQPLSRPLFIYISKKSLARREVELFVSYYLSRAGSFVSRVGYVPFADASYRLAHERIIARQTGSLFGGTGSQVGLAIEDLLARTQARASSPAP